MENALLVIIFLFLIVFGIPICFAMGIVALIFLLYLGYPPLVLVERLAGSMDTFPIVAIPLFILTAEVMARAKITNEILDLALSLVGHIKGALAHVNVCASIIFAGMSGSAIADAAGVGKIEIDMMKKGGYETDFAAAVTAASSTISPIIPPSIFLVLYA